MWEERLLSFVCRRQGDPVVWDDRFVWSRLLLALAAGCWVLACPILAMALPNSVPPVLVPFIPLVAGVALLIGRFECLTAALALGAGTFAALGWWGMWNHGRGDGTTTFLLASAVPVGGLAWLVFHQTREDDRCGLWRNPHSVSAALACGAVMGCGAWTVALWAMREMAGIGHIGVNGLLLVVWMPVSLWCALAGAAAVTAARTAAASEPMALDRLDGMGGVALAGVVFVPWALGSGIMLFEAATRGPFYRILHPEQTTPLWLAVAPVVIGISAINAARLLLALLMAPRYASPLPEHPVLPDTVDDTP